VADMGCERLGLVYSAILRRGGESWLGEIARDTGMGYGTVRRHLGHLMEMDLVEQRRLGVCRVRLKKITHGMEGAEEAQM